MDASGFLVLSKSHQNRRRSRIPFIKECFAQMALFTCKNPIFPLSQTAFTFKVWNKRRKMNLVLNKHNVMYVHTSKKGKLWDHGEKEQTLKKLYCIQQSILEHYCLAKFSDPYACANIILKNGIFLKGTRNFSL